MGAVERVGDHDAEHRVAEEFQAFVVRQPAVLVGVRAVGQGATQQLGVDRDTERLGEPGRVSRLRTRRHVSRPLSNFEDLLAVVLPAVLAGRVRKLELTARAVRARRQRRCAGLPLRPAGPGITARGLPLRDGHVGYSSGRFVTRAAASAAQRGSIVSCVCSAGSSSSRWPQSGHSPAQSLPAQRRPGQRKDDHVTHHRFEIDQVVLDPVDLVPLGRLVGGAVRIGEQLNRRRRPPRR